MSAAGRVGDRSSCQPSGGSAAATGSADTSINGRPALRVADRGSPPRCCPADAWEATSGAPAVLVNGRRAHRVGDACAHASGPGALVEGSPNVLIGDHMRAGARRTPGVRIRLTRPDGTPLPDLPYRLLGPEERSGTLSDGWVDERDTKEGKYVLEIDGRRLPLRLV
jgi:uncharacterized Zn-binding protein involved in type VI secretion